MAAFGYLWPNGTQPPRGFSLYPGRPAGRVLIAGLGREELPRHLHQISTAVGQTLAAAGFGLIAGGWPGVDHVVTAAFLERLGVWGVRPEDWLLQVIEPDREPRLNAGRRVVCRTIEESFERSLDEADAVILISGAGGTARIARSATNRGVPVLPLARTSGDAEEYFVYKRSLRAEYPLPGIPWADFEVLAQDPIVAVAEIPRLLRSILAHRTASAELAAHPMSEAPSPTTGLPGGLAPELWRNVVSISATSGQPMMTGFVLADPRIIVTDGFAGNVQQLGSGTVMVRDTQGRSHQVPGSIRRVGNHPFGPVLLEVPSTLDATGFRVRTESRAATEARIPSWRPAGFHLATGAIPTFVEETLTVQPAGPVRHLVRILTPTEPGSSGAPVLDRHDEVVGFIVAGSGEISYCYPAQRWFSQLVKDSKPSRTTRAAKAPSKAPRKTSGPQSGPRKAPSRKAPARAARKKK